MRRVRIPIVPAAAIVGVGLIGDGIDGSLGAGVALLGSAGVVFLVALVAAGGGAVKSRRRTFRHRSYLALDRWRRRRAVWARNRDARKRAELTYMERRRPRR